MSNAWQAANRLITELGLDERQAEAARKILEEEWPRDSFGWTVDDIETLAEEMGVLDQLDDDDLDAILDKVKDGFDATIGINWTVIETNIDLYLADKKRSDTP